MSNKSENSFWVSYSDLMTSLFLIMVSLFAVTIVLMVHKNNELKSQKKEFETKLREIELVEKTLENLPKSFIYNPRLRRHELTRQPRFESKYEHIDPRDYNYLVEAGRELKDAIESIRNKSRLDIKFTLLIEGMSSTFGYGDKSCPGCKWEDNETLSYRRAMSLVALWRLSGVNFDTSYCDLQIAGSGTGGIARYQGEEEYKNQRILIQVLPKVGNLKK